MKKFWTILDGLFLVSSFPFFFFFAFIFPPFPPPFLLYSLRCLHFNFAGGGKEEIMFCRNLQ